MSIRLRSLTPKSRILHLNEAFLTYLRADGIILPPEPSSSNADVNSDSGFGTDSDSDDEEDPSSSWPELHARVRSTIAELGGKVLPKLNWSAPKDATWISPTNDMECRTANEIYLLLKSSAFVTHDLEQAFDGCVSDEESTSIPYVLVLRKSFNLNPSLEFRCFVRSRALLGISQREMNYFAFLFDLRLNLLEKIKSFLQDELLASEYFSNGEMDNFVFDVYIPPPHNRVWLIDINPWAPRTDPLLFSWLELLTMPDPSATSNANGTRVEADAEESITEDEEEDLLKPEFRLVERDDPEAYQFSSTKYSAHKLPKDVVDASTGVGGSGGIEEMMKEWKKALDKQNEEDEELSGDQEKGWERVKSRTAD
jgi:D123